MSNPTVFVVRVWSFANRFRATARAVDAADGRLFTSPAALLRFLRGASESSETAGEPSTPGSRRRQSTPSD